MITPIIKVKANIILVTCGLLILMIHMALNQHQSGGRCDRLLQVTLTARFSIDPLSLYPHIHYTIHIHYIQNIFISTSKSFLSLPCIHTNIHYIQNIFISTSKSFLSLPCIHTHILYIQNIFISTSTSSAPLDPILCNLVTIHQGCSGQHFFASVVKKKIFFQTNK